MVLATIFAALATILWGALAQGQQLTYLSRVFFLVVLASWAVLVPAKFWPERRGDSWTRRVVMMLLGGLVGLSAWWLDGWTPGAAGSGETSGLLSEVMPGPGFKEAAYFSFYALSFFALRWWRMAGRRRTHRFSFAPILAAAFWGVLVFVLIRPPHKPGVLILCLTAAVVQLVSPWQEPPPPAAKRMRLRYA
jgi:hypothetical protein